MSGTRVLLVEDDATLRKVLSRELEDTGFAIAAAATAAEALELAPKHQPAVAVVDLRLPDRSGLELLPELQAALPDLQVIMLTGHGGVPEAVEAMRRGAYDFLTKPTPLDVISELIRRAAEKGDLLLENQRLRRAAASHDDPHRLLGSGEAMSELRRLSSRIGPTDSTVLVTGENGCGKELLARNLHRLSPRADAPWVVLNCAAISPDLVESELFGHEKGAFTGADRRKIGLFEAADQGSLFLDEVGELPSAVQPALLRVLQFGEIRPVGSTQTRTVDVRVIAATNRDLVREVRDGAFREDLFYRLSTFQLAVPPLRERPEDIAELARVFLGRASLRTDRTLELDESALQALRAHAWGGNVRELESAITRLSVLAPSDRISGEDVRSLALGPVELRSSPLPTLDIAELERLATVAALERTGGDKTAAAEALGVSLRTLYNKLKLYGLS